MTILQDAWCLIPAGGLIFLSGMLVGYRSAMEFANLILTAMSEGLKASGKEKHLPVEVVQKGEPK